MSSLTAPALDVIDVATRVQSKWPFAVVGLSVDRSLIFVRDILDFDHQNPCAAETGAIAQAHARSDAVPRGTYLLY